MKKTILSIMAVSAAAAFAVDEVTTSTTTSTTYGTGTIAEYTPGSTFVVKETSGPVKYKYGKKVTYVTKGGKTLSEDEVRTRIKVGAPVRVQYATEGDTKVISRVEIDDED
jgi:ligand-binding SRPBCC domain-containing protein